MVWQCNLKKKASIYNYKTLLCDTVIHYLGKFQHMEDKGKMPHMIHDQFTEEATMKKVHSSII